MSPSIAELTGQGKKLRGSLPRAAQADFAALDRDPVSILQDQNRSRLPELVPVRIGRMLQSPFAYYRGTASVMAADLAQNQHTGVLLPSCGDAHISNFGLFASAERQLIFDLNDFDEAGLAPWEWDLKRLAASVMVGARDNSMSEEQATSATRSAVASYRQTLLRLMALTALERYYFQVNTDGVQDQLNSDEQKLLRKASQKARGRTSEQVLGKIVARHEDGVSRIVDQPPIMRHVPHAEPHEFARLFQEYSGTVRPDIAVLLQQFTLVDYVLRVVGVGSVGTRCYVMLLEGPAGEPLFLQAKEAPPSVLQVYGGMPSGLPPGVDPHRGGSEGHRVVANQKILQASSDPFLGWIQGFAGDDGDRRRVDYYWRQFRDMKGSVETNGLSAANFTSYVEWCARLLARAHSQTGAGAAAAGYLGRSERFDEAIVAWSASYADQCEKDYAALQSAVKTGRMPAEFGV